MRDPRRLVVGISAVALLALAATPPAAGAAQGLSPAVPSLASPAQKPFVVHQFTGTMLPDRAKILPRPGMAVIFHADGFGSQELKRGVFRSLQLPKAPFHVGFKLFYKADTRLMTPAEAMLIRPQPDLITYQ